VTLTVADIERWDAGDVREVFHAASSRAQAALDAADGLATLPAFDTWGGEASESAREAIGKTRKDLDAHGHEALAVATAARTAADDIERIKSELTTLKADAEALDMEIDPVTGQVLPGPNFSGNPMELLLKQEQLQPRVDKLVADANLVDAALANAIDMAAGTAPIPDGPHANDPDVQAALNSGALPEDPEQFNELWDKLNGEQKDWLFAQNLDVGNHPGMPFVDKDHYNRLHLGDLIAAAQADVDRLAREHPTWITGPPTAANPNPPVYREWKQQWDRANQQLTGYRAVQAELDKTAGGPRLLGLLDDDGHAAVSIGNPDTATHNATFVPGTGQDLARLQYSTEDAEVMFQAALRADGNLQPENLAVTMWMGYDPPMNLGQAGYPGFATDGGADLAAFQDGMRASHEGTQSVNTVIGHSYGSTLVGAAASDGNVLPVDNVIAVGSPGMLVDHAGDLALDTGGEVYAMRARFDPINIATGLTLGSSPTAEDFGAIRLAAAPGPNTGPPILDLPSIGAHSSYWDAGNPALLNMGAIIAGKPPPHLAPPGG
jgi:hypothetical protein